MLKFLKTYLYYGKIYHTLWYDMEGEAQSNNFLFLCRGKRNKDQIDITDCKPMSSFSEIPENIKKNSHIHLVLTGKMIIHKTITKDSENSADYILSRAFPNLDTEQFYYSIVNQKNSYQVIICRKTTVLEAVERLNSFKIAVINISLGFQNIQIILKGFQPEKFSFGHYLIDWNGTVINSVSQANQQKENSIYTFEKQNFQAPFLVPVSCFSNYFNTANFIQSNIPSYGNSLLRNYKEKKFFRNYLSAYLLLLLLILTINYLIFNSQYTKLQNLKNGYQNELVFKKRLEKNKDELSRKEKLLNEISKYDNSKGSFYINHLVASAPSDILFDEINYQPLRVKPRPEHPPDLKENTIALKGISNKSEIFDQWVKKLGEITWIKEIKIVKFSQKKTEEQFQINISIKANDQSS